MADEIEHPIRVKVETEWIEQRSDPAQNYYFFAYHVTITNEGDIPAKLLAREWIITDADGNVETVRGPGVVGEQPLLQPGDSFQYTSFCPLRTPIGTMHGSYMMTDGDGRSFEAPIEPFTLAMPHVIN